MRRTFTGIAAALLIASLPACSALTADREQCKKDITEDFLAAVKSGADTGKPLDRPGSCDGLSDKELEAIGKEVFAENAEELLGDAVEQELEDAFSGQ
jgi:hypothetical protein